MIALIQRQSSIIALRGKVRICCSDVNRLRGNVITHTLVSLCLEKQTRFEPTLLFTGGVHLTSWPLLLLRSPRHGFCLHLLISYHMSRLEPVVPLSFRSELHVSIPCQLTKLRNVLLHHDIRDPLQPNRLGYRLGVLHPLPPPSKDSVSAACSRSASKRPGRSFGDRRVCLALAPGKSQEATRSE